MQLNRAKIKETDFLKYVIVNDVDANYSAAFILSLVQGGVHPGYSLDTTLKEYIVRETSEGMKLFQTDDFFALAGRTRICMSEFFTSEEETDIRPCPPSFCPKMGDTVFEDGYKRTYFGFVEGNHFYIRQQEPDDSFNIVRGGEPQEFLEITIEEAIGYIAMQQGLTTEQIKLTP
jgi:hypothetical protein